MAPKGKKSNKNAKKQNIDDENLAIISFMRVK